MNTANNFSGNPTNRRQNGTSESLLTVNSNTVLFPSDDNSYLMFWM
jgi:hypothetical protein